MRWTIEELKVIKAAAEAVVKGQSYYKQMKLVHIALPYRTVESIRQKIKQFVAEANEPKTRQRHPQDEEYINLLKKTIKELREQNAVLLSTLTRAQEEGTRLVLENRVLKEKLK